MSYNLTLPTNSTFYDLAFRANEFSDGILAGGFLLGFFVLMVLIIGAKARESIVGVFALSGFISFIVSLLFAVAEMVNFYFPIGFITITAFSGLYLYLEGK